MKPSAVKGVQVLKAYHPPLSGRDSYLRLDFNEWLGEAHPSLGDVLKKFNVEKLNMYPEAEKAIAAVAQQFNVPNNNVLLANGTDEAFCNVFRTYLDRGDKVLIPDPGYPMMEFYATLCEAEIVPWELEAPAFEYDVDKAEVFLKAGGKCISVGLPNNPTGSMLSQDIVVDWCRRYPEALIVADEAYIDFCGKSLAEASVDLENLLVFRTFSKAWSLAGLRLGAVVGSASMIKELRKMWSPYSVNILGLSILSEMLPDQKWIASIRQTIEEQQLRLKKELEQRGLKACFMGGNFFMMDIGKTLPAFIAAFEEEGVRLRDQSSKNGLSGWVRVSIGPEEITQKFLDVLDIVLQKLL